MTQVFISYRHISPDQDLAEFLEGYLKSRGIDVFIDTQMLVGDKWVQEIESSSDGSRLLIAWLTTGDSIKIDTLRFDAPDAPPIEGDPKELLNDWMKRLALKFDERWKIVPSQPMGTVKNER